MRSKAAIKTGSRHISPFFVAIVILAILFMLSGCETYLTGANAGYDRFVNNARTINNKQADIARDYAGSIANRVIWEMDANDQCIWESFVMRKSSRDCGNPNVGRLTVDEVLQLQGAR